MKRMITLLGLCVLIAFGYAQTKEEIEAARGKVGINAVPKATLEIKPTPKNAEEDADTNEGILIPRLSKLRVANIKTPEESTLVYIDDVSEGSGATVDHAVDSPGYYFFKEGKWVRVHDTTSPGFNALLHGEEAPASTLGHNGDFYITQKHKLLYGPKTNAGWGVPTSLARTSGPAGPIGSSTGGGQLFPLERKGPYKCTSENIGEIKRANTGYFTCKQFIPKIMIRTYEAGELDSNTKCKVDERTPGYSWVYTGMISKNDTDRCNVTFVKGILLNYFWTYIREHDWRGHRCESYDITKVLGTELVTFDLYSYGNLPSQFIQIGDEEAYPPQVLSYFNYPQSIEPSLENVKMMLNRTYVRNEFNSFLPWGMTYILYEE